MTSLTVVPPNAVAKKTTPTFKDYDDLVCMGDLLVSTWRRLQKITRDLHKWSSATEIENAAFFLDRQYDKTTVAKFNERLAVLDLPDAYDDDGALKKKYVALKVAELMGSYLQNGAPSPEVFVPALINEVMAVDALLYVELEMAFRTIRRKQKFLPAIAEVLTELESQQELWGFRYDAVNLIEDDAEELRSKIAEGRESKRQEEERRQTEVDRRATLAPGHRVKHQKFGPGTVQLLEHPPYSDGVVTVLFDHDPTPRRVVASFVTLLLRGDEGFEPASLLLEHRETVPMVPLGKLVPTYVNAHQEDDQ